MRASDSVGEPTRSIPRRERLVRCPYVQTNVRWPVPVDQRLNELVTLLGARGIHVTRSELVAALVADSPRTAPELQEIVVRYSQQSAGSVVLQTRGDILLAQRRPGRRANY